VIARFAFVLLALVALFYSVYWIAFRTNFITPERLLEFFKRFSILVIAILSATVTVCALLVADKF
jgi:hypothetical protein